jgi:Protein of unknown function (DUF1592)/Protein of unknown function (DUF1588)/Protein of unknown function (DUF1587)/Protein of unknown function (DUF1595)/Protein of unknown function (DUF1585)
MAALRILAALHLAAALALSAGCTGHIEEVGGGTGAGTGSGAGGSTGTGPGGGPAQPPTSAGVVTVRRLNHDEYNHTVRDLLGTTLTPADSFPADDLGGEFDTVGSALSLSPAYVIAYEAAAQALIADLYANAARLQRVVSCNIETGGDPCAQTVLGAFARRAWRRPVTADEVQGLMLPITTARMVAATLTEGLKSALAAVLLSPYFIFKVEIDPDPASNQSHRVGQHELATRMSYALWSSMPDDPLSAAADSGQLASDDQIGAQIDRMLADPRADSLLDEFAAEWLAFKSLEDHEVDAVAFPKYTPALALAMKLEARRFVQEFLRTALAAPTMLSSRFTFVDSTLATHYGLSRTGGAAADFVRVDTSSAPRAGLLTLGAFLTATSLPTRTSPVKRGQFIFSRLLCGTIEQPPPDVPPLPEQAQTGLSLRQRLEAHRSNPACISCHSLMDPLNFGLENYDAIGAYRTVDEGAAIDASGTMPDGTAFNGAIELSKALSSGPRFSECLTRKFMTFAIGRLLNQRDDGAWVSYLSGSARSAGDSLKNMIRAVVLSEAFRSRQSQPL